jgi:class 3 adenylate cyclase
MAKMSSVRLSGELAQWADHMEKLQWAVIILDQEYRLAWVSDELLQFIGATPDDDIGYGDHLMQAFAKDAWINTVHPDSQVEMLMDMGPYILSDLQNRGQRLERILPEPFGSVLSSMEPAEKVPHLWSTSFLYRSPDGEGELPDYRVNAGFMRINEDDGTPLGALMIFFMSVRPNLLTLLARGDEQMYERMAKLWDPGPRQAAVLFCDLHQSFRISRRLSSSGYFKLVRRLWTGIDAAIADEVGIVGKHAGDGASAYFLVDDLGSPANAAAAALRASRRIHEVSEEVFAEVLEQPCAMKVGVHWGGSLYMGQLVPGGRLDVTALGDEVNHTARVQESAGPGETLASKELFERLTDDDAAALGVDLEKVRFVTVAELDTAPEKAKADAGSIAVAPFS